MKCAYKYCQRGGNVSKSDAVKEGTRYFHPECFKEKKTVAEIVNLYHERVDPHPIEAYLWRTVQDLVYKDGNNAEYLLFAFRYCLDHGWTLHTPGGLRYVAKDVSSKKAWDNIQDAKIREKVKKDMEESSTVDMTNWNLPTIQSTNKSNKQKVSSILGV